MSAVLFRAARSSPARVRRSERGSGVELGVRPTRGENEPSGDLVTPGTRRGSSAKAWHASSSLASREQEGVAGNRLVARRPPFAESLRRIVSCRPTACVRVRARSTHWACKAGGLVLRDECHLRLLASSFFASSLRLDCRHLAPAPWLAVARRIPRRAYLPPCCSPFSLAPSRPPLTGRCTASTSSLACVATLA